jgi:hypothetical protein
MWPQAVAAGRSAEVKDYLFPLQLSETGLHALVRSGFSADNGKRNRFFSRQVERRINKIQHRYSLKHVEPCFIVAWVTLDSNRSEVGIACNCHFGYDRGRHGRSTDTTS